MGNAQIPLPMFPFPWSLNTKHPNSGLTKKSQMLFLWNRNRCLSNFLCKGLANGLRARNNKSA
ncbi:MAG: hypothetical protein KatS3mg112_1795 [Thermogutta sp.]|nr:MAG: hypothetical protein KatS3mg112_1795 [Thermogutta sp.]